MENLLLSFNVVAPLILYMSIGVLLRRARIVEEHCFTQMSQLVFYVAIPALCCENMRALDFTVVLGDPFALYLGAMVIVLFLISMLIIPRFCHDHTRCGVLVQGIFRSNDGVFGMAVGATLLGQENMGLLVLCIAITIPVYNILAVTEMEYFRGGKPNVGKILLQLLKNPIIIGCVLGAGLSFSPFDLPVFLAKPLAGLAEICAPLGFIALGGTLSLNSLKENKVALTWVSLVKLITIPAVVLCIFYLMGYRGNEILVAMLIFAAPSAMSVYPMACSMGGDSKLAGGIVAVTSMLSLITVFSFIFFLKQLGVA
ncbi:MAG: AEC family transporter [Clostridia bacterium]